MARCILLLASLVLSSQALAACPGRFEDFLERFENDKRFQLTAVRFPLQMNYLDESGDGGVVKHRTRLSKREYSMPRQPWYPSPAMQSDWKLVKTVSDAGKTRRIVRLEQADVDGYKAEFHFQKMGACWRLVLMDDQSF